MAKFLDDNGLLFFWTQLKALFGGKQDEITASGILKGDGEGGVTAATAGTDYALPSAIPSATTTTPKMDGTAAIGSETNYAKGDHIHPTDTSRQSKITASGILKGDGNGGVTAATAGTDYTTPANVTSAINTALAGITGISYSIVSSLPATGEAGVIYLVSHSGTAPDVYDEYIWVNNAFEKIGTTQTDLTGYWNNTNLVAITNAEISTILAS